MIPLDDVEQIYVKSITETAFHEQAIIIEDYLDQRPPHGKICMKEKGTTQREVFYYSVSERTLKLYNMAKEYRLQRQQVESQITKNEAIFYAEMEPRPWPKGWQMIQGGLGD